MAAHDEQFLHALAQRIKVAVQETGRCLMTQPADLAPLRALGAKALHDFAAAMAGPRFRAWASPKLSFSPFICPGSQ